MLAPWKKSYDKPRQHIKKQRHHFANRGQSCLVKAMVFPVIMYRSENWTIKKAEHQIIDAFELLCWRGLLRFPWTARISNQSILKKSELNIHWKGWCWSQNSHTLATWCADSLEKTLMLGKIEGRRSKGTTEDEVVGWHHQLNEHKFEQALGDGER